MSFIAARAPRIYVKAISYNARTDPLFSSKWSFSIASHEKKYSTYSLGIYG
jgi:hypothetical protein